MTDDALDPQPPAMPPHEAAAHGERLWTPWRMRYVGGGAAEDGCVFCNRLRSEHDTTALILWRGERSFLFMNLFPDNTGHVMLVPNEHVDSPETADPAALVEMATVTPALLRALRRALACHGFNLGLNVGSVAGAGIAAHLHQHVVPRWTGDANFMPILASTMVLPELIPVTYGKLRAELGREIGGADEIDVVVLDRDGTRYAATASGTLPVVAAEHERPLWRTAASLAGSNSGVAVLGWAGPDRAESGRGALALQTGDDAPRGTSWRSATESGIAAVSRALALRAPDRA
jgi:ATP adenylyltransferase